VHQQEGHVVRGAAGAEQGRRDPLVRGRRDQRQRIAVGARPERQQARGRAPALRQHVGGELDFAGRRSRHDVIQDRERAAAPVHHAQRRARRISLKRVPRSRGCAPSTASGRLVRE